jgi:hypothetical protein
MSHGKELGPVISVAEHRVLEALEHDEEVHLCGRVGDGPCPDVEAVEGSSWAEDRTLSASFIYMLISSWSEEPHNHRGLRIHGARITGQLDLSWVKFNHPIALRDCHLENVLTMESATIGFLDLTGSSLPGMQAPWLVTQTNLRLMNARIQGTVELAGARIGGHLECEDAHLKGPEGGSALAAEVAEFGGAVLLSNGFAAQGTVRLYGAKIGSNLECDDAHFNGPEDGSALDAEGADIGGAVLLRNGFAAQGTVRLYGAKIGSNLECDDAHFNGPEDGSALDAQYADIGGAVLLRNGFAAQGTVSLYRAKIGSNLECDDAHFNGPEDESALDAQYADIGGAVLLRQGFAAQGTVSLNRAKIGSNLDCHGANLNGPEGGSALDAEGADIRGSVMLLNGFAAQGTVSLNRAKIGSDLDCDGANLNGPEGGSALDAEGADIRGSVMLLNGFTAQGTVSLYQAKIGSDLDCDGGSLTGPEEGSALDAEAADIGRAVLLRQGFTAHGSVRLYGAKIGGDFDCEQGTFRSPDPAKYALLLERSQIGGVVDLRFASSPQGMVGLTDSRAAAYWDGQGSWPTKIQLEGFGYQRIQGDGPNGKQVTAAARTRWLTREVTDEGKPTYAPRPYEQLASVYRAAGQDREARQVAIANRKAHRRSLTSRPRDWPARAWSLFLGATVGHGYRPWQAAYWLAGAWIISVWVVSIAKLAGDVTPAREGAPAINPWAYALDVLVPVVDLGQRSAWQVTSGGARIWFWLAVLTGWALTTAVVAGVASAVRRE